MTESIAELQTRIARVALASATQFGFALAGGGALVAHGVVDRPTEDVDLFTNEPHGIRAAADLIVSELRSSGLAVDEVAAATDLGDIFDGFDQEMAEYEIRQGVHAVRLQLARFDREHSPIILDIGPVLHLDDVIGSKVAAMVTRAYVRDFIDVAAAHGRYTREQLADLGQRADPALTLEEFADAMCRLDRLDDSVFIELYQRTPDEVSEIRAKFESWPRA